MLAYGVKLLELLSIDKTAEKSFLKIRLVLDEEVVLFWEIDDDTASYLVGLTLREEGHKYRLSFHSSRNSVNNRNISWLTKTYKDNSERINFTCSDDYINQLKRIKSIEKIKDIDALPFLTSALKEEKDEQVAEEDTLYLRRPAWRIALILSITILTVFSFSSYKYFYNPVYGDNPKLINEYEKKEITLKKKEQRANRLSYEETKGTGYIPYIELKDLITYGLPEGSVAITFDDGPSEYTTDIIDILNEYQVGGTFFFIGKNVIKHPSSVQYVNENGYSIGNHGYTHMNFIKLSEEGQENELLKTNRLIEDITQERVTMFRPPYGSFNDDVIDLMGNKEMNMVIWNVDPKDWKSPNSTKIVDHLHSSDMSGSIILLHETKMVVEALPEIIEYLQNEDLQIVNLR
ncbi:polysaccharide deacetylase family protein [Evansella cellulosilytica]|uniref:Polysaccharide deacetylase n=1 Tax=Evansella cellulosilytica (strain ATCC 21833 / DSM 2522 / FERM P-1141 / JCM 9156 / N-4) TaxID=649639 RepID=E6TU63_EVAC2|nr:polysaccharide deacetylase family protein [Evansella cellulosilytica]ADU28523.1 polysaccharide deacetylase [Evansella cellulosilytica DSM 2522]